MRTLHRQRERKPSKSFFWQYCLAQVEETELKSVSGCIFLMPLQRAALKSLTTFSKLLKEAKSFFSYVPWVLLGIRAYIKGINVFSITSRMVKNSYNTEKKPLKPFLSDDKFWTEKENWAQIRLQIAKFDDPSYRNQNIRMYHRCVWNWEVQKFRRRSQTFLAMTSFGLRKKIERR